MNGHTCILRFCNQFDPRDLVYALEKALKSTTKTSNPPGISVATHYEHSLRSSGVRTMFICYYPDLFRAMEYILL